jgi:GNAT superfamily N-acetyltransferase
MPACAEIWRAGLDEYGVRVGRLPTIAAPEPLVALLGHLRTTDPELFLVAERAAGSTGEIVGFVSAILRGDVWFLSMLFVHPDAQSRGVGRFLLERVLPGAGDGLARATCTDSAQPISNALYARYGIVPRLPFIELVGRPNHASLPALPGELRAVPFATHSRGLPDAPAPRRLAGGIAALDAAILGYVHPEDHAYLAAAGRLGYAYEEGDDRIVGYGYVSPAGRIGPVAVEDESLFPAVLGHLLRAAAPAETVSAWVPGAAGRAVTALLEAGLRIEDFPALACWDRPFADLARYVPISLAVL